MLSQCPECKTVFRVKLEQLEAANGKVRCSRCHTIFIAADHPYRTKVEPTEPMAAASSATKPPSRHSTSERLRSSHPFSWPEVRNRSEPSPDSTHTTRNTVPSEPRPEQSDADTETPELPSTVAGQQQAAAERQTTDDAFAHPLESEHSALTPESPHGRAPDTTDAEPPAALVSPKEESAADDTSWLKYLETSEQVQAEETTFFIPQEEQEPTAPDETPLEENASADEENEEEAPWMKYIYGNTVQAPEDDLAEESTTGEPPGDSEESSPKKGLDEWLEREDIEPDLTVEGEGDSNHLPDEEAWWSAPAELETGDDSYDQPQAWFDDNSDTVEAAEAEEDHDLFAGMNETAPGTLSDGESPANEVPPSHLELFTEEQQSSSAETPSEESSQADENEHWAELENETKIAEQQTPHLDLFADSEESTFEVSPPEAAEPPSETALGNDLDEGKRAQEHASHPDLFADEPQAPRREGNEAAAEEGFLPENANAGLAELYHEPYTLSEEVPDGQGTKESTESVSKSRDDTPAHAASTEDELHQKPLPDMALKPPVAQTPSTTARPSLTNATDQAPNTHQAESDSPAVEQRNPARTAKPKTAATPTRPGYNLPPQLPPATAHASRASLGWGLGILLLSATLGLQYLYYQRADLAQSASWRPLLEQMCTITGCELPLRRDLQQIQLVDHMMQNHPRYQGSLLITATLANRADFIQPFPIVEVLMTDLNQQVVARRRFRPEQYLVGERAQRQFVPNTEVPLMLEVVDPGESAVGFEFRFY